jgi:HEAT repeat protein
MVELLHDRELPVRVAAAAALGALGDPLAVEPLIDCLSDRNEHVSYEAVVALAEIGDQRMRDAFIRKLRGGSTPPCSRTDYSSA